MIYLDYNATHPPYFDVLKKTLSEYQANWGNASGISSLSQRSKRKLEEARLYIENLFSLPNDSITFTSSGTEAIYTMVQSYLQAKLLLGKGNNSLNAKEKKRPGRSGIMTTLIEHPAMLYAVREMENHGFEIEYFPCKDDGTVNTDTLEEELEKGLELITCILVQNESGIIQPLEKIVEIRNNYHKRTGKYVPVFSDTIQAISKIDFPFHIFDGFTIAGHKFGAGIGSSAYYLNPDLKVKSLFKGGHQETGRRAGTENLFGIYSLANVFKYLNLKKSLKKDLKIISDLRDTLENEIEKMDICKEIIGKNSPRVYNTSLIIFKDIQLDFLLMYLDSKNIYISTGSSCKSGSRAPSDTLLAMGYNEKDASDRIRISIGRTTTKKEILSFLSSLKEYVKSTI
jgi:cysteine desulfurase